MLLVYRSLLVILHATKLSQVGGSILVTHRMDPTKAVGTVLCVPYGHMWKAPPRWDDHTNG